MNTRIDIPDEAAYLIQFVTPCLAIRRDQYHALQLQIAGLEDEGICNGTVYWRNEGTRKLYINHSVDESCPLHGTPPPGGRIRHYVGTKQDRQAEAQAAIRRWKEHRELTRELNGLRRALTHAQSLMADFYRALGFTVTTTTEQPTPRPHWTPGTFGRTYGRW